MTIEQIISSNDISKYVVTPDLILMAMEYKPFIKDDNLALIDNYYVTSNKMYKATNVIIQQLADNGYEYSRYKGSHLKSLAVSHFNAVYGINALTFIDEIGSYYVLSALTKGQEIVASHTEFNCLLCNRCIRACPNKALSSTGLDQLRCIRYLQENDDGEQHLGTGKTLLGCNICQIACPLNYEIEKIPVPSQMVELLNKNNVDELLANEEKHSALTELIGANYTKPSRLAKIINKYKINNK